MARCIERVRSLHAEGAVLYLWSTGGADYARSIAKELGIVECFAGFLPKPTLIIDVEPSKTGAIAGMSIHCSHRRTSRWRARREARASAAALSLMRQLFLILSAALAVGCSKPMPATALPSEHVDLSLAAFDYALGSLEAEGSSLGDFAAVLCLAGGGEPDAAFLDRVSARTFPVLPCSSSARGHDLHEFYLAAMKKSQTEFRIISIEAVAEGQARVRVGFRDMPSSSGMLLLELVNRPEGWTVTGVPEWAQT